MSVETKKKGLRERPTYNELIEDIQLDEKIKLPNRQAKFIRESPYLGFLDGEGYTDLLEQEEKVKKHIQAEHAITKQPINSSSISTGVSSTGVSQGTQTEGITQSSQGIQTGGITQSSQQTQTANVLRAEQQSQTIENNIQEMFKPTSGETQAIDMPDANIGGSSSSSSNPHLPERSMLGGLVARLVKTFDKPKALPVEVTRTLPSYRDKGTDTKIQSYHFPATAIQDAPHADIPNIEREYNNLMRDVAGNMPRALNAPPTFGLPAPKPPPPKPKPTPPKTKATPQPPPPKSSPPPPPAASPPPTAPQPKAKPKAQPKAQANPNNPPIIKTPGLTKNKPSHGTTLDTSTDRKHWAGKGLGYLNDQLGLRGMRIPPQKFRGKGALTKTDLLKMIYKKLGI